MIFYFTILKLKQFYAVLRQRDIKADNVCLVTNNPNARLKIIDYGYSITCEAFDLKGDFGTPLYKAPEIWNKIPYGKPVDMWVSFNRTASAEVFCQLFLSATRDISDTSHF